MNTRPRPCWAAVDTAGKTGPGLFDWNSSRQQSVSNAFVWNAISWRDWHLQSWRKYWGWFYLGWQLLAGAARPLGMWFPGMIFECLELIESPLSTPQQPRLPFQADGSEKLSGSEIWDPLSEEPLRLLRFCSIFPGWRCKWIYFNMKGDRWVLSSRNWRYPDSTKRLHQSACTWDQRQERSWQPYCGSFSFISSILTCVLYLQLEQQVLEWEALTTAKRGRLSSEEDTYSSLFITCWN